MVVSVGMSLSACGGGGSGEQQPATNTGNSSQHGPATNPGRTPSPTDTPATPPGTPCPTPVTPTPSVTMLPTVTRTPTTTPPGTPTPLPTNLTEAQMIDYIASFGIKLEGNWSRALLDNLWEALFTYIGYQDLKAWLNGRTATMIWGGTKDCGDRDACYGGSTPGTSITFKATATVNPVINILHEIGHLVDNLWYDYFTTGLEKTTFYDERGYFLAGWDGSKYVSLPPNSDSDLDVRELALKSSTFGGQDAWQQRGGTPHWEDWADIFSNSIIHNVSQTTNLGSQMDNFFNRMKSHVIGGTP